MAIQVAHHDRVYHPGAYIVHQDAPATSLFVLKTGAAMVVKRVGNRDVTLDVLAPGSLFGEMALIDGSGRSASVVAVQISACIELPAALVAEQVRTGGPLIPVVLRVLALRLRATSEQLIHYRCHDQRAEPSLEEPVPDPDTARHMARAVRDLETQVLRFSQG
jgi:CRP-like cAMP-binding protein